MVKIRLIEAKDVDEVMELFSYAQNFMKENGNPSQWGNFHPPRKLIEQDAADKIGYVIENNEGIAGYFALIFGDDPTYRDIEGRWLNNFEYATIHRLGGNGKQKGIFKIATDFAFSKINNVRIDTHITNKIMLHLFEKYDFTYCGYVKIEDGTTRHVYQKYIG